MSKKITTAQGRGMTSEFHEGTFDIYSPPYNLRLLGSEDHKGSEDRNNLVSEHSGSESRATKIQRIEEILSRLLLAQESHNEQLASLASKVEDLNKRANEKQTFRPQTTDGLEHTTGPYVSSPAPLPSTVGPPSSTGYWASGPLPTTVGPPNTAGYWMFGPSATGPPIPGQIGPYPMSSVCHPSPCATWPNVLPMGGPDVLGHNRKIPEQRTSEEEKRPSYLACTIKGTEMPKVEFVVGGGTANYPLTTTLSYKVPSNFLAQLITSSTAQSGDWQSVVSNGFLHAKIGPSNGFSLNHESGTKIRGFPFDPGSYTTQPTY